MLNKQLQQFCNDFIDIKNNYKDLNFKLLSTKKCTLDFDAQCFLKVGSLLSFVDLFAINQDSNVISGVISFGFPKERAHWFVGSAIIPFDCLQYIGRMNDE